MSPFAFDDENQALIRRAESELEDTESPCKKLKEDYETNEKNESRTLFQSLTGPLLEPMQCLCSCSWMLGTESRKPQERSVNRKQQVVKIAKYISSTCLLVFCLNLILAGIFAGETPVTKAAHPLVAFSAMWALIIWLGILEGGQGCLVGLQPIDKASYKECHPITHQCAVMAHEGDNLNRFIVGRQFLVVLVVFCLNLCCTVVEDAVVPGFPDGVVRVVLESGLAVMLITVILGQLSAEVNATNCMLDFINTPAMVVTTWICLAIETSGLLHSSYLVEYIFSWFARKSVASEETSRTTWQRVFFWARVFLSLILLGGSLTVTLSALLNGQTTMCEGLPHIVSISILVGLVCFLGMLEAMQIALFAVVNLPQEVLEDSPTAQANCKLVFHGANFKAFLIGRQICVTTCMFLLARITTTDIDTTQPGVETVLNVNNGVQDFFNTGLPGALITTIVASLAWRIVASSFPIAFMANPFVNVTIRLCLLLETSGVFSAAWLLADFLKAVVGFQPDEVYIGQLGQREMDDKDADEEEGVPQDQETGRVTNYGATTH